MVHFNLSVRVQRSLTMHYPCFRIATLIISFSKIWWVVFKMRKGRPEDTIPTNGVITTLLILLAFTICNLPISIYVGTYDAVVAKKKLLHDLNDFCVIMFQAQALANPLVYGSRNKAFKEELRKWFTSRTGGNPLRRVGPSEATSTTHT